MWRSDHVLSHRLEEVSIFDVEHHKLGNETSCATVQVARGSTLTFTSLSFILIYTTTEKISAI